MPPSVDHSPVFLGLRCFRILVVLTGFAALASSCTSSSPENESRSDPDRAATEFAAALEARDLDEIVLADGGSISVAQEELEKIVEGMGETGPDVEVLSTAVAGERATSTMQVSWPTGPGLEPWSYETTLELRSEDDRWAVAWAPSAVEPTLQAGERLDRVRIDPARGRILGAGDTPIVERRPVWRIGIDKSAVDPSIAADSAIRLAQLLGLEDPAAYQDQVQRSGERAFVEAIVLRADGSADFEEATLGAIEGAAAIDDELPLAPTATFARPILGTVGTATAEIIEASDGKLQAGDQTGLSGIQRSRDDELRGLPDVVVRTRRDAADGAIGEPRELYRRDAVDGTDVRTSIDAAVQAAAEENLAAVEPASAIVAIEPSSGRVLAAASGPGGGGYSTATLGQYAPGSTFKVVTALALLRAGLTPDAVLECTPTIAVDGRSFKNYDDYPAGATGSLALRQVIANSCNTALIDQRSTVSQGDLATAASALGLGQPLDIGVPAYEGSVPTDAGEVQHAASMIGQDRVLASPLVMATVAASVSRGAPVAPTLVEPTPTSSAVEQPVTTDEALQLSALMRAVVEDGSGRFLADLPGAPIGAKTGTAEYGTESPPRTHAWMIAIQGDLAVAVFVEDGAGGSRTAGPILESFLTQIGPR